MEQLNRAKLELLNPASSNPLSPREAAKKLRYVNEQIAKHLDEGEKLKSEIAQARAEEDSLCEELQLRESAFARNEILNFWRNKRFALNPKNFAFGYRGTIFDGLATIGGAECQIGGTV